MMAGTCGQVRSSLAQKRPVCRHQSSRKGAANAFLATKISFINAMADVCAATNADISVLARSLGLDPRIGPAFLKAGIGYGGACLPKDVRGLTAFAQDVGADNAAMLLSAVDTVNASRSGRVAGLVQDAIGEVHSKRVAIWGASFKVGTDDVRDSAGLQVADQLDACQAISITAWREAGWQVRALTGLHAGQSEGDPAAAAVLPPAGGP